MNDYTDIDLMLDEGDEEDAYYAAGMDDGLCGRAPRPWGDAKIYTEGYDYGKGLSENELADVA